MRPYLPLFREPGGRNLDQMNDLITISMAGVGVALQVLQLSKPFPAIFNSFFCLFLQICFNLYFVHAYNVKLTFHRYFPASLGHSAVFAGIIAFNGLIIYSVFSLSSPALILIPIFIFLLSASMIVKGFFF